MPAWDAALDAAATGKDADKTGARAGGRPYRKKKGAKALRPVRPRRVASEEPQTVSEKPKAGSGNTSDEGAKAEEISVGAADKTAPDEPVSVPDNAPARECTCAPVTTGEDAGSEPSAPTEATCPAAASATETTEAESASGAAPTVETGEEAEVPQAPVSGIQLTVTYDPYTGIEGEQALTATSRDTRATEPTGGPKVANAQAAEPSDDPGLTRATSSHPAMVTGEGMHDAAVETRALPDRPAAAHNPAKQPFPARTGAERVAPAHAVPAQTAPAQAPAKPAAAPAATVTTTAGGHAPSALALKGYPRDLARELRVPAALLGVLVRIVPMGSDALAELTEDFRVARGAGTVMGARARATFPLRHAGEHGEPVMATIRRQADRTGSGPTWELVELEGASPDLIAAAGIEGLPILADGPWFENAASPAAALTASPRRRFALLAYTSDEILAELARLACPRVWDEASLRAQLSFAAAAAGLDPEDPEDHEEKPSSGPDGKRPRTTFPTGLFTDAGKPISAVLEPTGDDIPYRLTGFLIA